MTTYTVALRKESVDRNIVLLVPELLPWWSLSARRAWIEITSQVPTWLGIPVALRKESVDRNRLTSLPRCRCWMSLSARRAWIEIATLLP